MVTSIINVFQIFDIIYLIIPQYSSGTAASRSLATFFFEEAFIKFQKGYGAAIAVALFGDHGGDPDPDAAAEKVGAL